MGMILPGLAPVIPLWSSPPYSQPLHPSGPVHGKIRPCGAAAVLMHAGNEYAPKPGSRQREFARAAIDAGAKLVVGHHPHVAQEAERYRGGAIFYSLGNFIFD